MNGAANGGIPRRALGALLASSGVAHTAETAPRQGALRFAMEFNDPRRPLLRRQGGPFDPYHAYFSAVPDRYWGEESTVATDPSFEPAPVNPFTVARGFLRIEAKPVPSRYAATSPKPYVGGVLTTANGPHWARSTGGFEQKFGLWEIRCRMARTRSFWSSFYLNGGIRGGKDLTSGEIDMFECLGHQTCSVYQTAHDNWSKPKQTNHQEWQAPFDWSEGFHTYGLLWAPDRIVWYVDGAETYRATESMVAAYRERCGPMFMVIGLGIGAPQSWPGPPDDSTVFPGQFDIDWIRVYAI